MRTIRPGPAACLLVAALASCFPSRAEEPNIYVHPSLWLADLSGDGHTGSGGVGREFDVAETFGLETDQSVPSLEAFLRFGRSRFILGWNKGSYEGRNRLDADLIYKGTLFPQALGTIRTEFDYDRRRLLYGRPFFDGKTSAAGLLFGLDAYRIDSGVAMRGVGSREVDLDSTVPVLGASITILPRRALRLYAEAVAMSINRGGVASRLVEGYGVAEYLFIANTFALSLGYRYASLEAEDEGRARFDLKQSGLFTGFAIKL